MLSPAPFPISSVSLPVSLLPQFPHLKNGYVYLPPSSTVFGCDKACENDSQWTQRPTPSSCEESQAPELPDCSQALPSLELESNKEGFPGGAVVESLPANAGDTGSSPGLGGSHMPRSN